MKREDIEKVYDQGKDSVVDLILHLVERIEKLESQLKKDSHNSSKPPSSDGLKNKRTKSQRRKTGKKSGGQDGHKGKTLEMTDSPDKTITLLIDTCPYCGESLRGSKSKRYDRRQEFDIPPIEVQVTEYQAEIKKCPHCSRECKADFPERITHKTQYGTSLKALAIYFRYYELIPIERTAELFEDIFSVPLCEGTILNTTKKCARELEGFHQWVTKELINSRVVHFDETGVNVDGKLHWLHDASTSFLTSYMVHRKRGSEACDAMGILPVFQGNAVHDHWQSYFKYGCEHVLCNAHHIRELTFVHEQYGQPWAGKMIRLLCEIKNDVAMHNTQGKQLDRVAITSYERRYTRILQEGIRANPPPVSGTTVKRGRKKKGKVLCLLERLRNYRKETLAYMYDPAIPFDNNLAERDVRMVKVQQKISGLFRTFHGAEQFCLIRSFISTVKKQRFSVIEALERILNGEQIYLEFTCK